MFVRIADLPPWEVWATKLVIKLKVLFVFFFSIKNLPVCFKIFKLLSEINDEEDYSGLKCFDCAVFFTSEYFLNKHLLHHIKQPVIILEKLKEPPIKITLKNRNNTFEIVKKSPTLEDHEENLATVEEPSETSARDTQNESSELAESEILEKAFDELGETEYEEITEANVSFSPNFVNGVEDSQNDENSPADMLTENPTTQEYGSIPGAEPTPPPEPSPEYPKIRIKTTGLLKEPLTITEITDDNPDGSNHPPGTLFKFFALI